MGIVIGMMMMMMNFVQQLACRRIESDMVMA